MTKGLVCGGSAAAAALLVHRFLAPKVTNVEIAQYGIDLAAGLLVGALVGSFYKG